MQYLSSGVVALICGAALAFIIIAVFVVSHALNPKNVVWKKSLLEYIKKT